VRHVFDAEVWIWDASGDGSWHFVSLPEELSDDLREQFGHRAAGFGSLKVEVTIGSSRWRTSVFPDKKRATYVLPVKKTVRAAEGLDAGSTASVELEVLV
jgi:hypothetical protein